MDYTLKYISSNANPHYHCLALFKQRPDLIAYCSSNQIYLHDASRLATLFNLNLLPIGLSPVRCNCLITHENKQFGLIIGGYDDGSLALYQCQSGSYQDVQAWSILKHIKQDSSLICLNLLESNDGGGLLVTLNNKATCIIYDLSSKAQLQERQKIQFPLNKIPEAACLIKDNDRIVLFVGGMDQQIHIYVGNQTLEYATSLKGHENAITSIKSSNTKDNLIASSSKDGYIRLWKIADKKDVPPFQKSVYEIYDNRSLYLESILLAHECSVTSLDWAHDLTKNPLTLISGSMDCTICLWQPDETGVWIVRNRLGQLYSNKNAFFCVLANDSLKQVQTANYTGASCIWQYIPDKDNFESKASFTGHFNEVYGIEWNHSGDFFVTVSKDQTTRVHCRHQATQLYHEISRAQIHGYDINCVALISLGQDKIDLIACGADQKVIRVVQPPSSVANLINCHTGSQLHLFFNSEQEQKKYLTGNPRFLQYATMTEGGTQVLGLMTKVQRIERQKITTYYEEGEEDEEQVQQTKDNSSAINAQTDYFRVPTEDYLVKHTLWPQMNKLYGHPNELLAVTTHENLMASSSTSLTKQNAFIVIWDTKNWKVITRLYQHKSSVNDLRFSRDGKWLLAVSKDRTLSLFETSNFNLVYNYECHSRAVTSGDISPDGKYLVTVSRDKSVKIHNQGKVIAELKMKQPLHSVRWNPSEKGIIACGDQSGSIFFLRFDGTSIHELTKIDGFLGHSKTVSHLAWNLKGGQTLLASCSHDHSVRVFQLSI